MFALLSKIWILTVTSLAYDVLGLDPWLETIWRIDMIWINRV